MTTRNYVPNDHNEGEIGVEKKWWGKAHIINIKATNVETESVNSTNMETKTLTVSGSEIISSHIKRNQSYVLSDITYHRDLSSWVRLECVEAGTTAVTAPEEYKSLQVGKYITDGTTKWIACDVRDGLPYGDVAYRPILKEGYVKLNGATVQRDDYPRLVKYATDNSLWTDSPTTDIWKFGNGDGENTFVLPDYRNLFIEGGDTPSKIEAGLPNIEGSFGCSVGSSHNKYTSGAFSGILINDNTPDAPGYGEIRDNKLYGFTFNATKDNAIYGKSNTVQPPSIVLIPQVKY